MKDEYDENEEMDQGTGAADDGPGGDDDVDEEEDIEDEEEEDDDEHGAVADAVMEAAAQAAEGAGDDGLAAGGEGSDTAAGGEPQTAPDGSSPPPSKRRRTGGKRGHKPWNDMLFELLRYRASHGNVMVPFKSGGELGKWVAQQRAQHQAMQKSKEDKKWLSNLNEGSDRLTDDRIKVLSSVGFVWDVVQADNDARWKRRFEELKEYKIKHGHCNVPQSTDLGKWVKMQRENKHEADLKKAGRTPLRKKPKPCLSQDRVDRLEAIGFQWRVAKPAVGWDKRYQQLIDYKNQFGDCNVPQSYPQDKPFGRWVMKQRCQHSLKLRGEKSQLTDDREKKLNDIGFSWVAPGFSKKTVTMPGDEEESAAIQRQAAMHQAEQERVRHEQLAMEAQAAAAAHVAVEQVAAGQLHVPEVNVHVNSEEYSTWNV
jgi:Helicase associated domain